MRASSRRPRARSISTSGRSRAGVGLSVLDQGSGVDDEDIERIFSAFEQGGQDLTDKPDGFGLGLHEARAIAQRHGGSLEYSQRKAGGSEFKIWIPLDPVEPDTAEPVTVEVGEAH